ncbi:MAG: glycosyltransferase family 4 protein [Candidatus Bathyarchaeia archaeon]
MKTVYLKGRSRGGPIHSIYKELIRYPPEGYTILTKQNQSKGQQSSSDLNRKQQLMYKIDRKLQDISLIKNVWYEIKTLSYLCIKKAERPHALLKLDANLIYCSQQLNFAKIPWIVDLEFANALVNYGDIRLARRIVQKVLALEYCKRILPWSEWAKRTLYRSLDCSALGDKIETLHFAISPKRFVKKKTGDKLRILFVGSTNLFNFLNFEWKGGFEVMEAFQKLSKKYDELELVIRAWVPPEIIERYSGNPNIKILYSRLTEEMLANLYESSDIFLFPSHMNLGMVVLEAMSYELPVVTLNLYDNAEAVKDMKTGVLIQPPPLPYYTWNGAPNHFNRELLFGIRHHRQWLVKQIVEKTSLLIEDDSLRRRIGREARHLIEEGEFSIKKRNEKLKRIFDEATQK